MVQLAGLNGERPTEAAAKKSAPNSQPPAGPARNAPVAKAPPAPKYPLAGATAKTDASCQLLPLDVQFEIGRVASPATMPARFLPVKQDPPFFPPEPYGRSPEDAKNGAEAAKALLSKDNPYFYDRRSAFGPEYRKGQALAAVLYDYQQKGDNANTVALINALGADEAAKLLAQAGNLGGPQANDSRTFYAQDQAGVNQVLAKALLTPGIQLGDGSQEGTLAHSLLQQAAKPGNALSIAGILSASGSSPEMDALKQQFHGGSPERALNGAEAAKDLLSKDNPYFYDHRLYRADPDYDPQVAKAQALTLILAEYESKPENKDFIAQLFSSLGPDETAKLLVKAGELQGEQFNVDKLVIAEALFAHGVELGDGTQQGTLAYSLLQQASQSGSKALSIAGILNAAGTSPQTEALKQQVIDSLLVSGKASGKPSQDQAGYANAARALINSDPALLSRYPGGIGVEQIFGSDAGVPDADHRFLNSLNQTIDSQLYPGGEPGKSPMTGAIADGTMYTIQQYLSGKGSPNQPPSQLLANMMSVLGPNRSYAVLSHLTPDQVKQLHIQDSLKTLTESGQFTADDAKALALAQAKFGETASDSSFTPFSLGELGSMGSLIASLPDSPNGTAVKAAYAEGCVSGAQQLTKDIASGKYSGQALRQLTDTLDSLSDNAANVSSNLPAPVKIQLFTDLHAAATQFANSGNGKQADTLNAYAAGLLDAGKPGDPDAGRPRDQTQIATALRAMGGVGADGAIDPNSELGKFLHSALRGQAAFGSGSTDETPNMDMPNGVTHLLNGIAASGDTKLGAGVLDVAVQWSIKNPKLAATLAAQHAPGGSPEYRNALTNLFDKSFYDFLPISKERADDPASYYYQASALVMLYYRPNGEDPLWDYSQDIPLLDILGEGALEVAAAHPWKDS
jgi:hypothetical protein